MPKDGHKDRIKTWNRLECSPHSPPKFLSIDGRREWAGKLLLFSSYKGLEDFY
jgi:hypothetical protein